MNMIKKKRGRIPQENKIRAYLQKETNSTCPFCSNIEVGHFEIHHIDEDPSNNEIENLILICPVCHSKIHKHDISSDLVLARKHELLKNTDSKSRTYSAEILFDNGLNSITFHPNFKRLAKVYRHQTESEKIEENFHYQEVWKTINKNILISKDSWLSRIRRSFLGHRNPSVPTRNIKILIDGKTIPEFPREKPVFGGVIKPLPYLDKYEAIQKCWFRVIIRNNGERVIENYKLQINIEGFFINSGTEEPTITELFNKTYQTHTNVIGNKGIILPNNKVLVQSDSFASSRIFIEPVKERDSEIKVTWNLLSKDYSANGELSINFIPKYQEIEKIFYIDPEKAPFEEVEYSNIIKEGIMKLKN